MEIKKKRRKKRHFNRKLIPICILIGVLLVVVLVCNLALKLKLIGDKDVYLEIYDSYFENGYVATFFGSDVEVETTNNINNLRFGDYEVNYVARAGIFSKKQKRNVHVVDSEKPEIVLNGNDLVYVNLHETFTDPGYKAEDNYDGDITEKVTVSGNVDANTIGKYELTYTVSDSSGNERSVSRTVEVVDGNILTKSISEFWLDGYYDNIVLHYDDKEYDYFKDTVFLGDSNTIYLWYLGKQTTEWQTWGRFNCNVAQINSSLITTYEDFDDHYLDTCFEMYNPKYLVISVGLDSASSLSKQTFLDETTKLINYLRTNRPDTHFAFSSILPVTKNSTIGGDLQSQINKYNYYLMELCYKEKVNFINFSDLVRGNDGYGNDDYFYCTSEKDCGFHLNNDGREMYVDYIKHLDLERVPE